MLHNTASNRNSHTTELTTATQDESVSDSLVVLKAITLVKSVLLPAHASSLAIRLIISGATKQEGCSLALDQLAHQEGVVKSTVIRMSKLLVELNIFSKEEHRNKPCVYRFNDAPEQWTQYNIPERILRVVESEPTESKILIPDEPTPLFAPIHEPVNEEEDFESCPYTPIPSGWRHGDGVNRYYQIPPIHDQDTGVWIDKQVESTGATPVQVVMELVNFVKGLASKLGVISLDAIAKAIDEKLNKPANTKDKPVDINQHRLAKQKESQQEYWEQFNKHMGYCYPAFSCLSNDSSGKYVGFANGQKLYVSKLMQRYPSPTSIPQDIPMPQLLEEIELGRQRYSY